MPFIRWDSIHFLHIDKFGYTNLKNYAFMPIFPMFLRLLISITDRYIILFLFINLIFTIFNTALIYLLSIKVLNNKK